MVEEKLITTKEFVTYKEHVDSRFDALEDKMDYQNATLEKSLSQHIGSVDEKLNLKLDKVDQKIDEVEERLNLKIDKLDQKIDSNHEMLVLQIKNMALQIKEDNSKKRVNEIRFVIPTFISIIAIVVSILMFILS
ncbi:hypothetical protein [Staphylococcus devriesei]|uniref:Uncharacterized protein n=1 Tax=Staphylococcus devriesei TaxID=586733 RepID=A0ABX5I3Y7_9STAP|nr:hypothetical protein [Staphylococcus devriesei]MCE5089485.1 hypothetical protein [Staphylococcus devriesei]MCE5096266.1 hypothetical protein [Staphylococcus devriesei]PNZ86454.1 hypothetical protein CD147_10005 [Staphylococcus devriesei]PTF14308.1 hypothetical protein BUY47_05025 [Staphylococcus devriesei]PTF19743.1 hypothetical protein BUY42_02780 [Staphylococcus devriesei]